MHDMIGSKSSCADFTAHFRCRSIYSFVNQKAVMNETFFVPCVSYTAQLDVTKVGAVPTTHHVTGEHPKVSTGP